MHVILQDGDCMSDHDHISGDQTYTSPGCTSVCCRPGPCDFAPLQLWHYPVCWITSMASWLRRVVSQQKRRLNDSGFDLDLSYIVQDPQRGNVIAMGVPVSGRSAAGACFPPHPSQQPCASMAGNQQRLEVNADRLRHARCSLNRVEATMMRSPSRHCGVASPEVPCKRLQKQRQTPP